MHFNNTFGSNSLYKDTNSNSNSDSSIPAPEVVNPSSTKIELTASSKLDDTSQFDHLSLKLFFQNIKQEDPMVLLKNIRASTEYETMGDTYLAKSNLEQSLLKRNLMRLKAVTLYQLALACEDLSKKMNAQAQETKFFSRIQLDVMEKIKGIEIALIEDADAKITEQPSFDTYWQINETAKAILSKVRKHVRLELQRLSSIDSHEIQIIYKVVAKGLRELFIQLLEACQKLLPPPEGCVYSIMILDSIARVEATPFSNIEWAILFEDQGTKKNMEYREYFRRFTELMCLKVINLGETTARMMDIEELNTKDEESQSPVREGFSFDNRMLSGCHTPLGNLHHTEQKIAAIEANERLNPEEIGEEIEKVRSREYELIGTPEELAAFQFDQWEFKQGFSTTLSTVEMIISNDEILETKLIDQYEAQMAMIWNEPLSDNKTRIQNRSLRLLSESNACFQFRGSIFDSETDYFDVEHHLYRLPNMLIDNLANYFSISAKNLWDRIEGLFGADGVVPSQGSVENLQAIVSIILASRLGAYLKKGYRDDLIIVLKTGYSEENVQLLEKELGMSEALLIHVYASLVPLLQWAIDSLVEKRFPESTCHCPVSFVKGIIYSLLHDYPKAAKAYEESKRIQIAMYGKDYVHVADTLNNLGAVYATQARYLDALKEYEEAERIYNVAYNQDHVSIANTLNNIGAVYAAQACYFEALRMYEAAKRIYIKVYGRDHVNVADILNNLGDVAIEQGYFTKAREQYQEAERLHFHLDQAECDSRIRDSYLREGNNAMLQTQCDADITQVVWYYAQAGFPQYLLRDPSLHQALANVAYKANQLFKAIEHYQIAIQLKPKDALTHEKLARLFRVRALIEHDNGKEKLYEKYVIKSNDHFRLALLFGASKSKIYVTYAQFLWFHQSESASEEVIKSAMNAIQLKGSKINFQCISYRKIERLIVLPILRDALDREKSVSISTQVLAYYVLVQAFVSNQQLSKARAALNCLETLMEALPSSLFDEKIFDFHEQLLLESRNAAIACLVESKSLSANAFSSANRNTLLAQSVFRRRLQDQGESDMKYSRIARR